jgi:hypothetical protein
MPWSALGALPRRRHSFSGATTQAQEATLSVPRTTRLTADDGLEYSALVSPTETLIALRRSAWTTRISFVLERRHSTPVTGARGNVRFNRDGHRRSRLLYLTANGVYVAPILGGKVERCCRRRRHVPRSWKRGSVAIRLLGARGHRTDIACSWRVAEAYRSSTLNTNRRTQLARDSYELQSCDWSRLATGSLALPATRTELCPATTLATLGQAQLAGAVQWRVDRSADRPDLRQSTPSVGGER